MKKTILLLALILIMVLSTSYAYVNPERTNVSGTGGFYSDGSCFLAEGDIYCYSFNSGGYDYRDDVYKYDVELNSFSHLDNKLDDNYTSFYEGECEYYNETNMTYCFKGYLDSKIGFKSYPNGAGITSINTTNSILNLSLGLSQFVFSCDLRPSTDEIYCWGDSSSIIQQTYDGYIYKYDIGDDSWDKTIRMQTTSSKNITEAMDCKFKNSEEFWCAGGLNETGIFSPSSNNIYRYNVTQNAYDVLDFVKVGLYPFCSWHDNIFYCYGSYIEEGLDIPSNRVSYYDTTDDSYGYTDNLSFSQVFFGTCVKYNETTDYCIGGYATDNWYEYEGVWEFDFTPPCEEYWLVQYSDNTSCLINDTWRTFKTYIDLNSCGTFDDLPVDNGTHVYGSCDYCTPDWYCYSCSGHNCLFVSDRNTCYDTTDLMSDKFLGDPIDYSSECGFKPSYASGDISVMVINFLGVIAVQLVAFSGMIALMILYLWMISQTKK